MLPLYQRNTLMEMNGVSDGGDQNYLVMAGDRRYSNYVGRALNRFEPDAPSTVDVIERSRGHTSKTQRGSSSSSRRGGGGGIGSGSGSINTTLPSLSISKHVPTAATHRDNGGRGVTDGGNSLFSSSASSLSGSIASTRGSVTRLSAAAGGGGTSSALDATLSAIGSKNSSHHSSRRSGGVADEEAVAAVEYKLRRAELRKLAAEKERGRGQAMTSSMVRMAFGSPLPSLQDLRHLEEREDMY